MTYVLRPSSWPSNGVIFFGITFVGNAPTETFLYCTSHPCYVQFQMNFSFPNFTPVHLSTVNKFLSLLPPSIQFILHLSSELVPILSSWLLLYFPDSLKISPLSLLCPSCTRVQCRSFCLIFTTIKRKLKVFIFITIVGIKWPICSVSCVATCQCLLTFIGIARNLGFVSSAIFKNTGLKLY